MVRPITLWPFPSDIIKKSAENAKSILVTEMSMGQMVDDIKLAVEAESLYIFTEEPAVLFRLLTKYLMKLKNWEVFSNGSGI